MSGLYDNLPSPNQSNDINTSIQSKNSDFNQSSINNNNDLLVPRSVIARKSGVQENPTVTPFHIKTTSINNKPSQSSVPQNNPSVSQEEINIEVEDPYDPLQPNTYEEYLLEKEERKERKRKERERQILEQISKSQSNQENL